VEEVNNLELKCRNHENEIITYQRKTKEYENTISRDLQTKITFISQENEDLKLKVRQLTGEVNKIPEFESKFAMVYSEVERLNTILRTKTEEIHTIDNKYRQS
jgi:predicted RNase H-like nuclease (RuvC/YqgF family)